MCSSGQHCLQGHGDLGKQLGLLGLQFPSIMVIIIKPTLEVAFRNKRETYAKQSLQCLAESR